MHQQDASGPKKGVLEGLRAQIDECILPKELRNDRKLYHMKH